MFSEASNRSGNNLANSSSETSTNAESTTTAPKRKPRFRRLLIAFVIIVGVWVLGDFIYSKIVENAVAKFEATIERDEEGVQVGARSWTLNGGPENDTACLLVHGFNDTPQTYLQMGPVLNKLDYTVRAVRMPGFGVHVDEMKDCTYEQWVAKVISEAEELNKTHRRVFIVGHSLGGAVTIASVLERSELFSGMALLAPGIDVANHRSPIFPTRFWRGLGDRLLYFSTVYQSPYDRNDCRDPKHKNPPGKPPFSTRNIVQQSFRLMDHNKNRADEVKLPTLMVLSHDDQVVDWAAAQAWFNQLGSSDKDLKFYDRSGHALTVDYDWENVTQDIIDLIDGAASTDEPLPGSAPSMDRP